MLVFFNNLNACNCNKKEHDRDKTLKPLAAIAAIGDLSSTRGVSEIYHSFGHLRTVLNAWLGFHTDRHHLMIGCGQAVSKVLALKNDTLNDNG